LQPCHFGLLVVTLLLTALSIPLIYSASTAIAIDQHGGDQNFFLTRQMGYALFGAFVMLMASRVRPEKLRTVSWVLFAISILGLVATKFTPLGYTMGNVERWVKLGPLTFQFSELAKIALIGIMADFWSRAAQDVQRSWWPWAAAAGLAIVPVALVVIQPHLSAALVLIMIPGAIALYAGAPWRHILSIVGCAAFLVGTTIVMCKTNHVPFLKPYQTQRLMAHFGGDGASDARGNDYQALQGQRAIVRGGALGVGPGASLFKQGHLPAPHTDFIYAVIGEEWGLIGTLGLLALYACTVFFCFQIGHTSRDPFQQLLCAGMGTLVGVQALGNVAVVTGVFPVTGMPLPIITFGGSGLWCILGGLGLVLAVSRSQNEGEEEE
jgi:cell division protein FtsW